MFRKQSSLVSSRYSSISRVSAHLLFMQRVKTLRSGQFCHESASDTLWSPQRGKSLEWNGKLENHWLTLHCCQNNVATTEINTKHFHLACSVLESISSKCHLRAARPWSSESFDYKAARLRFFSWSSSPATKPRIECIEKVSTYPFAPADYRLITWSARALSLYAASKRVEEWQCSMLHDLLLAVGSWPSVPIPNPALLNIIRLLDLQASPLDHESFTVSQVPLSTAWSYLHCIKVEHKLAKPRLPLDDVPDFSPQILCWPAKLKEPKAQAEKLCLKFQNGTLFRLQTVCNGSVKGMVKRWRWKPLWPPSEAPCWLDIGSSSLWRGEPLIAAPAHKHLPCTYVNVQVHLVKHFFWRHGTSVNLKTETQQRRSQAEAPQSWIASTSWIDPSEKKIWLWCNKVFFSNWPARCKQVASRAVQLQMLLILHHSWPSSPCNMVKNISQNLCRCTKIYHSTLSLEQLRRLLPPQLFGAPGSPESRVQKVLSGLSPLPPNARPPSPSLAHLPGSMTI